VIYEAENHDRNAATYLLFIGSRQPERWAGVLPGYRPLERSAKWIGATPFRDALLSVLSGKFHRLKRDAA
jgi:hypothetical protein